MGCAASQAEPKVDQISGNLAKRVIDEVNNGKKKEHVEHTIMGDTKRENNKTSEHFSKELK